MLENWIFLSLLAPLFWAFSTFVDKYILGKHTKGVYDFLFLSAVVSLVFVIILIPIFGVPDLNNFSWIPIITGALILYSYGFYAKALEKSDTSTLTILFKLIPLVTVALAFIFLNQKLSLNEWFSFGIIFTGAVIVSLEKIGEKRNLMKGFWWILPSIFLWAIITLMIDYGLTKITFWDYFILDGVGSGLGILPLFLGRAIRQEIKNGLKTATTKKYSWFAITSIFDFWGHLSIRKALAVGSSAGLISVITQVQSFYAIMIGLVLSIFLPHIIKEDISAGALVKKIIGAAIMFTGVYVLLT